MTDRAHEIAKQIVHVDTDGIAWTVTIWDHTLDTYTHRDQAVRRQQEVMGELAEALRAYVEAVAR